MNTVTSESNLHLFDPQLIQQDLESHRELWKGSLYQYDGMYFKGFPASSDELILYLVCNGERKPELMQLATRWKPGMLAWMCAKEKQELVKSAREDSRMLQKEILMVSWEFERRKEKQVFLFEESENELDVDQFADDLNEHQDLWEDVFYEMIARERFGREGTCVENIVMVASPGQSQKMFKMAQGWNPCRFRWLDTDEKVTLSLHYEFLQSFIERDFLFLTWER